MISKPKLIRITTVPDSLFGLLPEQMLYMSQNGFDVTMMSADNHFREKAIENEKCPHIIVPLTRKITPFQDLYCIALMIYHFIKIKPDIVHTHTPKAGLIGMIAAYICRVPVRLHTVAGLPLMVQKGFKYKLLLAIEKITYFCANKVFPNSYSLKKYMLEKNMCPLSKLDIIGFGSSNGINLKKFSAEHLDKKTLSTLKEEIKHDEKNTYLLSVGRVVKDKGIEELVAAFIEVKKENANLKLILVGSYENDLDPISKSTLDIIQNNEDIIAYGHSNRIEYFMELSDLFIHASYREGFPNVLLQAGAMNCPIICSKIPGNIDVVAANETGLLFEVQNTSDLQKILSLALNNESQTKIFASNLSIIVKNRFERGFVHSKIKEEYIKFLSK